MRKTKEVREQVVEQKVESLADRMPKVRDKRCLGVVEVSRLVTQLTS